MPPQSINVTINGTGFAADYTARTYGMIPHKNGVSIRLAGVTSGRLKNVERFASQHQIERAYRYTEWRDWKTGRIVARELYDHNHDPGENRNIAGAAGNRKLIFGFSKRIVASFTSLRGKIRAEPRRKHVPTIGARLNP